MSTSPTANATRTAGSAPGAPRTAPRTARGARTRARILKAAEEAFGTTGFHGTGIADITRAAGVALGSFYTYFGGKEDVLRELVQHMGRQLRAHLEAETADAGDRLQAEELGLRAFLQYLCANPALYRVLQQAQFVDETIYRDYYQAFGERYLDMLASAAGNGEISPGNNEVRVWALMGMSNFLGIRYALWNRDVPVDEIVATVSSLLRTGLSPHTSDGGHPE